MKKTGLLFIGSGEVDGVYRELFISLDTGRLHIVIDGLTSISGK